ncbi:Transmembrane and coiled-coil domain-containing protein 4 [Linum perenne]
METSTPSILPPTQRYAAGALFALSLHQAQIHQIRPWGLFVEEVHDDIDGASLSSNGNSSVSDDPDLWVHEKSGLLRLVFRFLEIDPSAWYGLEETAGSTGARCHIGAFLRLLTEDSDAPSPNTDKEIALSNAIDVTEDTMETNRVSYRSKKKKHREYENECREKLSSESDSRQPGSETPDVPFMTPNETAPTSPNFNSPRSPDKDSSITVDDKPIEVVMMISYHRKVTVLYELLSACLADIRNDSKSSTRRRKGYDARHRVALRLLSTWFDISWIKMEAAETMVACSAMAILKQQESKGETQSSETKWARIRRGSIIGAAAITGGALMAITGGLAAPAIAAGFGALAPTLGTLIPVIGASGFAAAATAAGTVAGSVAVAASFGGECLILIKPAAGAGLAGTKMARRTGSVEEFEFKPMGDSHNQGRLAVGIMISGFIFDEEDFFKPWEGLTDNLERYALQWESKNLIAISTAIRDWLTSTIASQLMRQGAMLTVMGALMAALYLPTTILAATSFIDSTWTIAIDRTDKAGKLLAEVLLNGVHGNRPVTLVGYSLGARVIFKCLQTLAETERNAEVVERVVLLGAPVAIKNENWGAARKMVAGRFVNAYSTNDWMLGVAFRANLLTQGLAGIQPIEVPGIENVDVTEYIEGHSSYLWAAGDILERLELDTYFPVFKNTPFSPSRRPGASKEEAA